MCGISARLRRGSRSRDRALTTAALAARGPDALESVIVHGNGGAIDGADDGSGDSWSVELVAALLHMRGGVPCAQPAAWPSRAAPQLWLCWNGEAWGGTPAVPTGESDTAVVLAALGEATAGAATPAAAAAAAARALAGVEGEFAFVCWHVASRTLLYGRDACGRRSLLLAGAGESLARDAEVSSVAPVPAGGAGGIGDEGDEGGSGGGGEDDAGGDDAGVWAADATVVEVPPDGVHALSLPPRGAPPGAPLVRAHAPWPGTPLGAAVAEGGAGSDDGGRDDDEFAGASADADAGSSAVADEAAAAAAARHDADAATVAPVGDVEPVARELIDALAAAVRARVSDIAPAPSPSDSDPVVVVVVPPGERLPSVAAALAAAAPRGRARLPADGAAAVAALAAGAPAPAPGARASVAVLFSGGLDSCVLARLAADAAPAGEPIDLLSVDFAPGRRDSPDRVAAREAVEELRAACPSRAVQLILVDADYCDAAAPRRAARTLALLRPCATVMDFNLGSALWAASQGVGWVEVGAPAGAGAEAGAGAGSEAAAAGRPLPSRVLVRSSARALLSGFGADEALAGYARHRAAFARGAWRALAAELARDAARLPRRNCGRDDRVAADAGRELRLPFLDERVRRAVAAAPLRLLADPRLPPGEGDKRALRVGAALLGLPRAAARVKRALQFGSRVAAAAARADGGARGRGAGAARFA